MGRRVSVMSSRVGLAPGAAEFVRPSNLHRSIARVFALYGGCCSERGSMGPSSPRPPRVLS